MATVNVVLRTCGSIFVFTVLCLCFGAARFTSVSPSIRSFSVIYLANYKSPQDGELIDYVVQFLGDGFFGNMHWKISSTADVYGSPCKEFVNRGYVREVEATYDKYVAKVTVPVIDKNVYFCLFSNGGWTHQGEKLTFVPSFQDKGSTIQRNHIVESGSKLTGNSELQVTFPNIFGKTSDTTHSSKSTKDDSVLENKRNYIPNTSLLNKLLSGEIEKDLIKLSTGKNTKYDIISVMADSGNIVPGDNGMSLSIQSSVGYKLDNLGVNIPAAQEVGNGVSDTMYKKENRVNYIKSNDYFNGNVGEFTKIITSTNDITESVPDDANSIINNKRQDYEISNHKSKSGQNYEIQNEGESKFNQRNFEINTWKYFKDSRTRIPTDWINLSHDINVNFPGSGVVLDVEGDDVEKNIFDSRQKSRVPNSDSIEYQDMIESNKERLEIISDGSETYVESFYGDNVSKELETLKKDGQTVTSSYDRQKREIDSISDTSKPLSTNELESVTRSQISSKSVDEDPLRILALRVEASDKDPIIEEDGIPTLLSGTNAVFRLFGTGLTEGTLITFTKEPQVRGGPCQFPATGVFALEKGTIVHRVDKDRFSTGNVKISLPHGEGLFYLCAKRPTSSVENSAASPELVPFVHQGTEPWLQIKTFDKLLPLWAQLMIIVVCLMFSALFSGLNLGLMSLDRTELKILCNTGTEKEKEYARVIQPVRDHGNFLLCSILLGNVAVNSTFTILLDDLTSGVVAVICSTITIVLLGEITPQAICSRYGLAVGAKTIHVTKAVMALTFPLSYPVSKLLDFLLGEEIGNVYNRERLKELVRVTNDINDLDKDEVNIISGALEMRKKTVLEIMTKIEDVFMLDYEAVLDFETVSEIMKSGFSRIPVFENQRSNIVAMLYVKDLAFVDPDDNTPLKTLCQFYQNPCNFVFEDVTLDVIFKQFKEGHKGHLAFVQRVNSEGEGDPFYETVGLVTLEDVIEELIQAEIMDETDVFTDNKSKRRRNHPLTKLQDFGVFAERRENQRIRISPQLTLATFQYLSTSVEAFKSENVSETILRRLLKQDIIHHIKFRKERLKLDPSTLIYEQGKPVDYFVLILEGRVEVTVGKENLVFESGPFTFFGSQALMQNVGIAESPVVPPSALGSLQSINMDSMLRYTFIPDYSVRAVTEVFYVSIKRSLYLAAKRASLMERCSGSRHKGSEDAGEQFDDEVEKLLHSLEEEGSPVTTTRSPSHLMNTSRHASPLGPNGSIKTSRQSSPAKQAPVAQQEPEFIDTTPTLPQETSTLLPHS